MGEEEWRAKMNKPFSQNKLAAKIPKQMKKDPVQRKIHLTALALEHKFSPDVNDFRKPSNKVFFSFFFLIEV